MAPAIDSPPALSISTSISAAASSTVRASGPMTEHDSGSTRPNGVGTSPRLGLWPTSPQNAAGIRIDPAPSLPTAIGTIPAAIAAEHPPDDPPEYRDGSHGLRVGGWMSVSMIGKHAS